MFVMLGLPAIADEIAPARAAARALARLGKWTKVPSVSSLAGSLAS
jgi:hypothetical protein